jgi:hypothetical protein
VAHFCVGRYGWSPRSPDFSEPYYFLWGYLNSGVYVTKTRNNEEFKVCIRDAIAGITEVLRSGINCFQLIMCRCYCFGGSAAFVLRFPQVDRQSEWYIHLYVSLFYLFFLRINTSNLLLQYVRCV